MSIINNICEHGQLQRKCEVCELKAEIARLRSACLDAGAKLHELHDAMKPGSRMRSHTMGVICDLANAGKEPSDGSKEMAENNDDQAPDGTVIDQERAMYHLRCLGVDCGWRAEEVEDFIKDREAAMKAVCTEVGTRGATIMQQSDRIAALESTERELREAVRVLAVASMGAEDAKWRMRDCEKSIAGACGQTVQECFAAMRYHNVPSSIFDRFDETMQVVMTNPIAAAAVREASDGV